MSLEQARFPIVGIGASAGGVQALEALFKGVASDVDMAYVVVTHLSPDRESHLHDIIRRHTELPVHVATHGARVEPRAVYVMPPAAVLSIKAGVLQITQRQAGQREPKPIDVFFSSLAEDCGDFACGVVLSGGDGDGTLGVKAIKERNGLTLAQTADGSGPQNPDMPESAIASGLIDIAVPAQDMGDRLSDFARSFSLLDGLSQQEADSRDKDLQRAIDEIYAILRDQAGHDFSGYKTKTFLRRVHRRMQVMQVTTIDDYVAVLRKNPGEVIQLFRNLLINVTNFFRDQDAFATLEREVIPKLLEGRAAQDTVRVWVPGCATGEEVYSIAMLMRERLDALNGAPNVQIFATDIDDAALGVARAARYPGALLDSVSLERRKRFFTHDGASYVVRKEVRDMCIFSPHSVIKDPPFSRMDLVSCRNLLIYFGADIQNRILPTFHYSLKPGGYLFLGTAENVSQHTELFSAVDKKQRIFQSRNLANSPVPVPIGIPRGNTEPARSGRRFHAHSPFSMRQNVDALVMEQFAPPHVVVNQEGDVVYYSARTGKYLEPPQGVPNRQLVSMARRGLRLELRSAFQEAKQTRHRVVKHDLRVDEQSDRVQFIDLTVEPLPDRDGGEMLFLVLFSDVGEPVSRSDINKRAVKEPDATTAELERELRDTRESLQATIEEYETALEELKSANEELVSVNEEAQSTNEELEASKEELQSLNEELNTINYELNDKVVELDQANSDLKNLFESTRIATVFLDRSLVIRNFTPAASRFFSLLPSDIGRPLTDLATHLAYDEMKSDIQAVFENGDMVERQMDRNEHGLYYLVRIIPYRGDSEGIEGVVVTFVDVTAMRDAEEHQRVLIAELNHRVKNLLGLVTSVAKQTMMRAGTKEEFFDSFLGRINAMARAHSLLSRENWLEASLGEVVSIELDPIAGQQSRCSGPQISLLPKTALSVSMVVHELATNASKYGALSTPKGRVNIEWSVEGNEITLVWRETGGPKVQSPQKDGFGITLVKGEIEYSLGGTASPVFDPEGLIFTFSFPLRHEVAENDTGAPR